ncbi:MAG: hypothetical protein EPN62_20235 [Candidimonas sp.]|nr:MAG: hypothetical protein EPN62_20235 [Candidimonas sp.]
MDSTTDKPEIPSLPTGVKLVITECDYIIATANNFDDDDLAGIRERLRESEANVCVVIEADSPPERPERNVIIISEHQPPIHIKGACFGMALIVSEKNPLAGGSAALVVPETLHDYLTATIEAASLSQKH